MSETLEIKNLEVSNSWNKKSWSQTHQEVIYFLHTYFLYCRYIIDIFLILFITFIHKFIFWCDWPTFDTLSQLSLDHRVWIQYCFYDQKLDKKNLLRTKIRRVHRILIRSITQWNHFNMLSTVATNCGTKDKNISSMQSGKIGWCEKTCSYFFLAVSVVLHFVFS